MGERTVEMIADDELLLDPREFARKISDALGDWAGVPVPLDGFKMILEPGYPNRRELMAAMDLREHAGTGWRLNRLTARSPKPVNAKIRNVWYSRRHYAYIVLYEVDGKIGAGFEFKYESTRKADFWLQTLGASLAYDLEDELRAQDKLCELTTSAQFERYMLTGTFLERSTRAPHLFYMLRRLRPTIVFSSFRPWQEDSPLKVLATLCMHPVGYYHDTWAGAMVPTDDVIAHLQMIRGDEHLYWRRANQHNPDSPEAGL